MSLNGSLDGLVEELQRLLVQAEAEVHLRQQAYEAAVLDARRLRSMLKASGAILEEAKPEAKAKVKRAYSVKEETRVAVIEAIRRYEASGQRAIEDVPGSFTASDIKGDFHDSSARTAIHMLREQGVIRAVGKVPNSPRLAPMAYARVIPVEELGADDVG